MPLPPPPTRKPDNAANRLASSKANKDLLIKGVLCALVGATILLPRRSARSPSVQELMAGASVVVAGASAGAFAGIATASLGGEMRVNALMSVPCGTT